MNYMYYIFVSNADSASCILIPTLLLFTSYYATFVHGNVAEQIECISKIILIVILYATECSPSVSSTWKLDICF